MPESTRTRTARARRIVLSFTIGLLLLGPLAWIGSMRDEPADYSSVTIAELRKRIAAGERDIEKHGNTSWYLDADRYWPYDRDRAVLAMFEFRDTHKRWPENWGELQSGGALSDPSCIHENWDLVHGASGWEIRLENSFHIATWRKATHTE